MKQDRKPFLPVTSDIDDEKIERLAQEKGVASMVRPVPAPQTAGEGAPVKAARKVVEASESTATPRSKMKAVNLELPDYAWTDLKIRAAQMQTSVRHIVMKALKADGIAIRDVNAGENVQQISGAKVQHRRQQEGPRYRGPSCLWSLIAARFRRAAARS